MVVLRSYTRGSEEWLARAAAVSVPGVLQPSSLVQSPVCTRSVFGAVGVALQGLS